MKAELPELEMVRRDLEREVVGRKVKEATAAGMAVLPRYKNRKSFAAQLDGVKITGVIRQADFLLFPLDSEDILVIRMGEGMLRRNANKDKEEKGTEIIITFTQGGQLRFVDAEGTGEVAVVPKDDIMSEFPELNNPALDPIDTPLSWLAFRDLIESHPTTLKELLIDGQAIVAIGSIYADEVLFDAGLRYDRSSTTLSTQEVRRLYRSLVETLHNVIKYRGTTLEDRPWADVFGEPGIFDQHLQVFGRDGDLSPRSRTPIQRAKFKGEWTYFCETQV
ncbi:MAG: DNA-formamidopyrimidine glycosylase family protein [Acidimicrobiia bacterium]|nr:DNA-formamidopyrimidine glycosylase family protein [Acidimicrobiia bacterium]